MKKILGIHGRGVNLKLGESSWFQRKPDLESRGCELILPQFNSAEDPSYESWEKELKKYSLFNFDCVITTSHGGGFLIKYLLDNHITIPKLIMVCPGRGSTGRVNTGKIYDDLDSRDIDLTGQVGQIYVLHSRDDDVVPFERGEELAHRVGAELIIADNLGHRFIGEGIKMVNDLVG